MLHSLRFSHLSEAQFDFVMHVCARRGLDPWMGHVTATVVQDASTGLPALDIVTTYAAVRLLSERTGLYDGENAPQWCGPDGVWVDVWDDQGGSNFPLAAMKTVRRRDITEPFVGVAMWGEYAEIVDGKVSDNWKKHGVRLLAERAAILGHISAFPEECSSIYSTETDPTDGKPPEPTVTDDDDDEADHDGPETRPELAGMMIDLGYKTPAQRQVVIDAVAKKFPSLCEESQIAFYAQVYKEGKRLAKAKAEVADVVDNV